MQKLNYDFLKPIKKMPPLRHKIGDTFDVNTSEVISYMIAQPEVRQKLFDVANQRGVIIYDPKTKTWRGCDYDA